MFFCAFEAHTSLFKCAHPHLFPIWDTVVNGWWMTHGSSRSIHSSNLLHSINSFLRPEKQGLPGCIKAIKDHANSIPPRLVDKLLFEKNEHRIPTRTHFQLRATTSVALKFLYNLDPFILLKIDVDYFSWAFSSAVPRKVRIQFIQCDRHDMPLYNFIFSLPAVANYFQVILLVKWCVYLYQTL